MNRRRFLELLGQAVLGSGIVYSFPSVITCKNIAIPTYEDLTSLYNKCIKSGEEPQYGISMLRITNDPIYGFGFYNSERKLFEHHVVLSEDVPKNEIWFDSGIDRVKIVNLDV